MKHRSSFLIRTLEIAAQIFTQSMPAHWRKQLFLGARARGIGSWFVFPEMALIPTAGAHSAR